MAFPVDAGVSEYQYFQGILISELVVMLTLYAILQAIHYLTWGYDDDQLKERDPRDGQAAKKEVQCCPEQKWNQPSWNMYFPIMFGNHVAAIFLPIIYLPSVYTSVTAYIHLVGFIGILIVNIFIKLKPEQPVFQSSRSSVSRIFWGIMCVTNIALMIGGIVGTKDVLI